MSDHGTSGMVAFKPRARLLKLIGAELISDDVVAITELVKNAHDADARTVAITFRGVTGPEGEIVVTDDGFGMDLDTLLGRWMEPAGSSKTGPQGRMTPNGRRMLGEKGVGRFAADKLGSKLELVSRRLGQGEVLASFDWDQFDSDDAMLAQIKNRWEIRPAVEIQKQGTILKIGGLRNAWTERMFRRLMTRLSRLQSPFATHNRLAIRIDSDEFPDYSGELASGFLDQSPYRMVASFDGREEIQFEINGTRSVVPVWNGGPGTLSCGPVRIHIYGFDLETEALAKVGPRHEVRAWLREWSGISVYRDGFRVWPYGEPHDDWLRLDQRRVNNPVVKMSNNQVVGFVEIGRDSNPDLKDQTNREGFVQTPAVEDLRRLMGFVLQQLESERQNSRHPVGHLSRVKQAADGKEPLVASLLRLAGKAEPQLGDQLKSLAGQIEERLSRQTSESRKFIEGYSDLAAVGQGAMGFAAAVEPLIASLRQGVTALRTATAANRAASLKVIESASKQVDGLLDGFGLMGAGVSRRRRTIDVAAELTVFKDAIAPLMAVHGASLDLWLPMGTVGRVEMNPQSLRRVLQILVANSLDWFGRTKDPEIQIAASAKDGDCDITVTDNGPGIPGDLVMKVFEPMFSLKEGGMGMGLTIARNIVHLDGGTISAIRDGRRRGAAIRIVLPLKRAKASPRVR